MNHRVSLLRLLLLLHCVFPSSVLSFLSFLLLFLCSFVFVCIGLSWDPVPFGQVFTSEKDSDLIAAAVAFS